MSWDHQQLLEEQQFKEEYEEWLDKMNKEDEDDHYREYLDSLKKERK
jgi:hypothetical protein